MEVSQFLMRQMKWSRGISVVEIHGASLWCEGPSNEMRSRGFTGVWWGGLACFHFRLTDFGFFFPQCSRITNCFVTRMWFSIFFLLLDFWNKSFWNVFFKVKLMTVLDIFQTNVFVFPLFFFRHMDICLTWFEFYTVIVLILCLWVCSVGFCQ